VGDHSHTLRRRTNARRVPWGIRSREVSHQAKQPLARDGTARARSLARLSKEVEELKLQILLAEQAQRRQQTGKS